MEKVGNMICNLNVTVHKEEYKAFDIFHHLI